MAVGTARLAFDLVETSTSFGNLPIDEHWDSTPTLEVNLQLHLKEMSERKDKDLLYFDLFGGQLCLLSSSEIW